MPKAAHNILIVDDNKNNRLVLALPTAKTFAGDRETINPDQNLFSRSHAPRQCH